MTDNFIKEAKRWNESQRELELKNLKNHKIIIVGLGALLSISLISTAFLFPLKKLIPIVIPVDKSTGNQTLITTLSDKTYTPSEAIDKFNISRYIKAREGYYFEFLQDNYQLVHDLTDDRILDEYDIKFRGKNALNKVFKDDFTIEVKIISININKSNNANNALVRALLIKKDLQNKSYEQKSIIINLSYYYDLEANFDENTRLNNPLGFVVETYVKEEELI